MPLSDAFRCPCPVLNIILSANHEQHSSKGTPDDRVLVSVCTTLLVLCCPALLGPLSALLCVALRLNYIWELYVVSGVDTTTTTALLFLVIVTVLCLASRLFS